MRLRFRPDLGVSQKWRLLGALESREMCKGIMGDPYLGFMGRSSRGITFSVRTPKLC